MQRTRRLNLLNRLWTCFLLFYSGLVFLLLVLGTPTPSFLIIPFYLLMPGYAFVAVVFPQLRKLEKVAISIGFSIAFIAGIRGFMQAFPMISPFSELAVLTIFSIIFFIAKLAI